MLRRSFLGITLAAVALLLHLKPKATNSSQQQCYRVCEAHEVCFCCDENIAPGTAVYYWGNDSWEIHARPQPGNSMIGGNVVRTLYSQYSNGYTRPDGTKPRIIYMIEIDRKYGK